VAKAEVVVDDVPRCQAADRRGAGRELKFMSGQGKGGALPIGSAIAAASARPDDFQSTIAAMARGDHNALSELYDSTVGKVHGLVRAIVANAADAEEVTCDVYTQAWQTAANYDPARGNVVAWLLAIARSRALDCLRRTRSKLRIFSEASPDSDHPAADAVEHRSPEHTLAAFQSCSVVRSALEQLSPERRRLVSLAFFEDLTHSEIAELTGLPMGTIKSHLRRAMHSLRALLYDAELE